MLRHLHLGFYDEPIRNIALVVGLNATQENEFDSSSFDPGATAMQTAPPIRSVYKYGSFFRCPLISRII